MAIALKRTGSVRTWIILLIAAWLTMLVGLPGTSARADTPEARILVLPFQIHGPSDLSYLDAQISSILIQRLEKEGATVIAPDPDEKQRLLFLAQQDPELLRKAVQDFGADQVVWGSFTMIGQTFSLDGRLLKIEGSDPIEKLFVQGRNLENLLGMTQELASQISYKIFPRDVVARVQVRGNVRIESDAILLLVRTQAGSTYQPAQLSKDLHAIYQMGYFDDIRVEAETTPQGRIITFHVTEKPTVRRINIVGNAVINESKIRENLTISTGSILNLFKVRTNMDQIRELYRGKNYYNVQVDYAVHPVDNNQADLEFIITEGSKIYVTRIRIEGNQSFTTKKLLKEIKTSEKGFLYMLTDSGDLKRDVLDQDVARLTNLYQNQGFAQARVGEPVIEFKETEIHITFKIEEGPRYRIRKVDITGDLIQPREELLKRLAITSETNLNRDVIRDDVLKLSDIYADQGYAYVQVIPSTQQIENELMVDITFTINQNQQVYFEAIDINGNTRTRDKVIRRELKVVEQGLFDNQALRRSVRNLYRLDYFEDIKIDTFKGAADNTMNVKIDVTEKSTGSFNFGLGYSDQENGFLTGTISERNLFGRGQTAEFAGLIGSRTVEYKISFTEPWLFDIPLLAKIQAWDRQVNYTEYNRHTNGAGLMFGYRLWDYTNLYWGYDIDNSDITIEDEVGAPDSVKLLEGNNITSSTNVSLVYDSRDKAFNASEGGKHLIFFEYAGLGGDIGYNKLIGQSQFYFPIYKKLIGFVNIRAGVVDENDDHKILPDYEKFYLGGINTMRGFGYHGVSLTEVTEDGKIVKVGGNSMVHLNTEIIFPVAPKSGIFGMVFYDTGSVFEGWGFDLTTLRQSAGLGIRWLSPIAPIQVVYGWVLDRKPGEDSGRFEFSLGASF